MEIESTANDAEAARELAQATPVRSCQLFDGGWDDDEIERAHKLPWSSREIPDWMITWWKGYLRQRATLEKMMADELKYHSAISNSGFSRTRLVNFNFSDLSKNSKYSAPYCQLFTFCDGTGRQHYADVIVTGVVMEGRASAPQVRYRFIDLIEQTGMLAELI